MPIRQYLPTDKESLLCLIADHASATRAVNLREHWQWQFIDNPFITDTGPIILVLEEEGRIVGALLSFPLPMKIKDKVISANCMMDFIVHPDHLGGGIGLAVKMAGLPQYFYGFPNRASHPLWQKLGCHDFTKIDSLCMVVSMKKLLLSKHVNSVIATLIGGFWAIMDRLRWKFTQVHSSAISIAKIEHFDESFDELWDQAKNKHLVSIIKNRKYLNWRYSQCPKEYTMFSSRCNGKSTGYVVIRIADTYPLKKGYIVDMLTIDDDSDTVDMLLQRAIHQLKEQGADNIICMLPVESLTLKRRLRINGFIFNRWSYPLVGNPYFSKTCDAADLVSTNWFQTQGDGELDLVADS